MKIEFKLDNHCVVIIDVHSCDITSKELLKTKNIKSIRFFEEETKTKVVTTFEKTIYV